tara:strand:+ start:10819 stop:11130 length:312 start_codon:yes stop_codon:yes gene_type:complete
MSEGKCWWRYNNQGGRYKTCEINQYKKGAGRKPKEVVRITPEEFVEKLGVDYSKMKKAQRNEYHRLDMAQRRKEEREVVVEIVDKRRKARKKKQNKKKPVLDK